MIYVINLKHRTDRLISIQSQLIDKSYKIIEAIDGVKLLEDTDYRDEVSKDLDIPVRYFEQDWVNSKSNFANLSNRISYKYKVLSCLLSHLKALKVAYEDNEPNPLILEDDAVIQDNDFMNTQLPDDYEICNIGPYFNNKEDHLVNHNLPIQRIDTNVATPWCSHAYFVKNPKIIHDMMKSGFRDGKGKRKAKSLTAENKIILGSADAWIKNNIYPNCPCYMTLPIKVSQGSFSSDICHKMRYKLKM